MKFIVQSAEDYRMTSKNYELIYGLKLYAYYAEDAGLNSSNGETNIYYIETDSLFDIYEFMNKTEKQKIIIKKEIESYYIECVLDAKELGFFDGVIIIYNNWVE